MWPIGHWADVGAQHLCSFAGEERCCCLAVSPARPDRPGSHHQRNFVLQTPGHGFLQRLIIAQAYLEGLVLGTQNRLMQSYGVATLGLN
jgi:hypothetical protein